LLIGGRFTTIRGPDVVISQLEPKLDSLIELMAAFKIPVSGQAEPSQSQDEVEAESSASNQESTDVANSNIAEGVFRLKKVAEKVVSSANTVIGSGSTAWGGSVFSYQPELGDHQL
jgi:hypothetical protein